ncbi:MAG: type II secretion system protein GspD [Armatimonadetes bacterium]|nr:type II secretion system protein GspD [Armatimonadota bacterium]
MSGSSPARGWMCLTALVLVICVCSGDDAPTASEPAEAEPLVSNSFFNTDIRQVLSDIALDAGVTILQDESVAGFVTLELQDVPLSRALRLLLLPLGMVYKQIEPGVYLVTASDPMAPSYRLVADTEIFTLTHLEPADVKKLLPEKYSQYITVDAKTRRCLVYAPEEIIAAIRPLLAALDAAPVQVMIEALVLEANAADVRSYGLAAATTHIAVDIASGLLNYQSNTTGVGGDNRPGTGGPTPVPGNILAGLKALLRNNKATLRANPRIVAADGEQAEIEVGTEQYFSLLTGSAAYAYTRLEKVDATIRLTISPRVMRETGEIICHIEPSVADVTGEGVEGLPVITIRRVKSNVRVRSGQAIVIGGLLQETTSTSVSSLPVLGDLPVIGKLFQSRHTERAQRDIIFVIAPHLLDEQGQCQGPLLSELLMSNAAVTSCDQIMSPRGARLAAPASKPKPSQSAPRAPGSGLRESFRAPAG